ncbi:hypothetical protein PENTCL1PPCAC_504, partial [Pristionchus entomophagus]
ICRHDLMEIILRKDLEADFLLNGDEPECSPTYRTFREYDGYITTVKTWTLPLIDGSGPCGLRFVPDAPGSAQGLYSVTIFGPDRQRQASCTRTAPLNTVGAHIYMEVLTPNVVKLEPLNGTVEVQRKATISASFRHQFNSTASISLHPLQCWLINERSQKKRLVIDRGCPLLIAGGKRTIVSIGSESADEATGDHPHVFFN